MLRQKLALASQEFDVLGSTKTLLEMLNNLSFVIINLMSPSVDTTAREALKRKCRDSKDQ
jgi:hypothetical protein